MSFLKAITCRATSSLRRSCFSSFEVIHGTIFCCLICPHSISLSSDHEIKSDNDRVRKVFQDSTGSHLLVCMKNKDCYYIGQASRRSQPRVVPKIKGQVIESVAWNKLELRESTGGTGAILLGTAQGNVWDLCT